MPTASRTSPHQNVAGAVTPENVQFYHENGYLVAPDLLSADEIKTLREETVAIFRGERGHVEGLVDVEPGASPEAVLRRYLAIHFPHKMSEAVLGFVKHPAVVDVLTEIVSSNVKCVQSMLFVKAPGKPGQSWHQDEYFIPTRDRSLTGAWIAVDDAAVENGCLWIIPRSQQDGYIRPRVPYSGDGYGEETVADLSGWDEGEAVPVEVASGSVVFFNGYVLHASLRNKTEDRFRTALVNHYTSAETMLPWDNDGRLEPTDDMRDVVLVAGGDPYAHKGTADLTRPFLRPDLMQHERD